MPATTEAAAKAGSSDSQPASDRKLGDAPIRVPPRKKPNKPSDKKLPLPDQYLQTISAFYIYLGTNILAALYAPIQDCDEVFNYWEPTHYLNHAFGLQTWEYSPEYSIRSWLYIVIHAMLGKFGSLFSSQRTFEFYFIRIMLAFACALCQSRLFSTISRTLNPRVGVMFMLATLFSPGMFYASVAFLPSSFSMYTTMLGMAAFMDWRGGLKSAQGIMWFGIGAIVGWPFSGALTAPFVFEDIVLASMMGEASEIAWRYIDGIVRSLLVLALQIAIDVFFYHKVVVVPWWIVFYNVFSDSSRGPDIFGTEPWDFYIRNLLLNFNIWFLLAMAAGPFLSLQFLFGGQTRTSQNWIRNIVFVTPFYIWLAIFSIQPHKEERFMYPAYPCLGLNAAIALHTALGYFGSSDPKKLVSKIHPMLRLVFVSAVVLLSIDVGVFRTYGLVSAYRAPLQVYAPLQRPEFADLEETVCIAKEWYRFPSSYFLPSNMRAKFVKSAFDGLLPGEFNEAKIGFGLFPGTWLIPPGMNDQNTEDPGKHFDIDHCSFLVDSYFPGSKPSTLEPNYVQDTETWEELQCADFLDASQTHPLARILWVPDLQIIPARYQRKWGRHCLLRRRRA